MLTTLMLALISAPLAQFEEPLRTQCMVQQGSYQSDVVPCTVGSRTLENGSFAIMYLIENGGPAYGFIGPGFVGSQMEVDSIYLRAGEASEPGVYPVARGSICTRDDQFISCGVELTATGTSVTVVGGAKP